MPHGFDFYNVFISAPGDLDRDRQACYDAIAQANESIALAAKVLLVSIGLRDNATICDFRSIVSDNVRWSFFFLQLFQDDWGQRDLFRKLWLLAVECRDDAAMPMRDVVVFLKDAPHETNAEILAWRREVEERADLRVIRYANLDELKPRVAQLCEEWARAAIAANAASATTSG